MKKHTLALVYFPINFSAPWCHSGKNNTKNQNHTTTINCMQTKKNQKRTKKKNADSLMERFRGCVFCACVVTFARCHQLDDDVGVWYGMFVAVVQFSKQNKINKLHVHIKTYPNTSIFTVIYRHMDLHAYSHNVQLVSRQLQIQDKKKNNEQTKNKTFLRNEGP